MNAKNDPQAKRRTKWWHVVVILPLVTDSSILSRLSFGHFLSDDL
jgi:hypothetical protein